MNERPEILMTPGPTPVPPAVLAAQARPLVYHRGPGYAALLDELVDGVRWLLDTKSDVVVYTASGTGGMEGAVANIVSAGDKVLVVSVGYFGERFKTICERFGCDVTFLGYEWGKTAKAEDVAKALDDDPEIKFVFVQHSETSTGVVNDVEPIAREVKARDKIFILDAISSAGAIDIRMDDWGLDVVIGGSQKALGAPPGISFVAIGKKGWEAHRASTAPRFYFDWTAYKDAADRDETESPWTPAVSIVAAMVEALRMAREDGRQEIFDRHILLGKAVKAGVQALGLDLFGEDPERAHVVTTVRVPEGISDSEVVGLLRSKHAIVTGPGQGPLKGQVFRLGHLGWVEPLDVIRLFGALELVLAELGYTVKFGAAVGAAEEVFNR
ncbi:MAG: alanine--glyoxylate aminotransferase family protein [Actinobacteria bacterium]|nr:alanine--glyoxylate aminotransferase family protein [Actinomycetota bacterium]